MIKKTVEERFMQRISHGKSTSSDGMRIAMEGLYQQPETTTTTITTKLHSEIVECFKLYLVVLEDNYEGTEDWYDLEALERVKSILAELGEAK